MRGEGEAASRLALTLLAFIAGSMLSGLLFSDKAFRLGNRYGVLLISFGLLLGLSYALNWQASWLYLLASVWGPKTVCLSTMRHDCPQFAFYGLLD